MNFKEGDIARLRRSCSLWFSSGTEEYFLFDPRMGSPTYPKGLRVKVLLQDNYKVYYCTSADDKPLMHNGQSVVEFWVSEEYLEPLIPLEELAKAADG